MQCLALTRCVGFQGIYHRLKNYRQEWQLLFRAVRSQSNNSPAGQIQACNSFIYNAIYVYTILGEEYVSTRNVFLYRQSLTIKQLIYITADYIEAC